LRHSLPARRYARRQAAEAGSGRRVETSRLLLRTAMPAAAMRRLFGGERTIADDYPAVPLLRVVVAGFEALHSAGEAGGGGSGGASVGVSWCHLVQLTPCTRRGGRGWRGRRHRGGAAGGCCSGRRQHHGGGGGGGGAVPAGRGAGAAARRGGDRGAAGAAARRAAAGLRGHRPHRRAGGHRRGRRHRHRHEPPGIIGAAPQQRCARALAPAEAAHPTAVWLMRRRGSHGYVHSGHGAPLRRPFGEPIRYD
jgi:hypothetical protein